jgi:hypothetical protein
VTYFIELTAAQVSAFRTAIDNYADGGDVIVTGQGDGDLVCGFTLATVTISRDGSTEVN